MIERRRSDEWEPTRRSSAGRMVDRGSRDQGELPPKLGFLCEPNTAYLQGRRGSTAIAEPTFKAPPLVLMGLDRDEPNSFRGHKRDASQGPGE